VIAADLQQVSHLILGQVEINAVVDTCHRTDRNGDSLLAPQVARVDENICHVVIDAVNHQSLQPPKLIR